MKESPTEGSIGSACPPTKRLLDLLIALPLCLLISPLLAMIAAAIKCDSSGPVLFVQDRWGYRMRPFRMYKFRTLQHNTPDPCQRYETLETDQRITCVGAFLRRTSLDELPQLFNVLQGSMSLVGPRPLVEWESLECLPSHAERFLVLPGITGWSQVCARNAVDLAARSDLDVEYVRRWSLFMDIKILGLSLIAPWMAGGVYPASKEPRP